MKPEPRNYDEMNAIMQALGCDGENGIYTFAKCNYIFDLTANSNDHILLGIISIAEKRGQEAMQLRIQKVLGLRE